MTLPDESPRPARPGQHPGADVDRRSHVAGAARQVGDGSAARQSPPPPPPPNVPALDETKATGDGKTLSVRERMEEHRKNPACTSCHRVIDPLGLALENFDVDRRVAHQGQRSRRRSGRRCSTTAPRWRARPACAARCSSTRTSFLLSFTESLMTYALGRRVEYYDMPAIRAIVRDAAKNDYRMSAFILGVVNSAAFQMGRRAAGTTRTRDGHGGAVAWGGRSSGNMQVRRGGRRPDVHHAEAHFPPRPCCAASASPMALPLLEAMVPARRGVRARPRGAQGPPRRDRDGARLRRQHQVRHQEEHVVAGRGRPRLRPDAERASARSSRSATT